MSAGGRCHLWDSEGASVSSGAARTSDSGLLDILWPMDLPLSQSATEQTFECAYHSKSAELFAHWSGGRQVEVHSVLANFNGRPEDVQQSRWLASGVCYPGWHRQPHIHDERYAQGSSCADYEDASLRILSQGHRGDGSPASDGHTA